MNVIFTIIVFITMLAVLIFVHEFGHFIAAKRSGVRVDEFGFGFPPRLFGKKYGETLYSVNLLPLGGFVKVFGENSEGEDDPRSFVKKSFYTKMLILFAGVIMNFFLAFIIFSAIQVIGIPTGIGDDANAPDAKIFIGAVAKDGPAQKAGIKANDIIKEIHIDGAIVYPNKIYEVQNGIKSGLGKNITVIVLRGDKIEKFNVVPRIDPPVGEGALGIELLRATNLTYPWYEAFWRGAWITLATLVTMISGIVYIISEMFRTGAISSDVAGPVGIANLTGQMTALGLSHLLHFMAIISLNLAVLNALPFPALDGGRAFILLLEKIRHRDFSMRTIQLVNGLGFAVLIIFVLFVTINDIGKLI